MLFKLILLIFFLKCGVEMSTNLAGRRKGRALWPPVWQCWTLCWRPGQPAQLHLPWPWHGLSCSGKMQHKSLSLLSSSHFINGLNLPPPYAGNEHAVFRKHLLFTSVCFINDTISTTLGLAVGRKSGI